MVNWILGTLAGSNTPANTPDKPAPMTATRSGLTSSMVGSSSENLVNGCLGGAILPLGRSDIGRAVAVGVDAPVASPIVSTSSYRGRESEQ